MKDLRISKKNTLGETDAPERPNPRLLRAGAKQHSTFSDLRPVDTHNPKIIDSDPLPELHDPTHKQRSFNVDKGTAEVTDKSERAQAVSFYLRSAFAALEEVHRKRPRSQLSWITVNFDHVQSDLIVSGNASKAGATFYKSKLADRFRRGLPKQKLFLKERPRFMLSLEDSEDGSLHAHLLMQHHPDDVRTLREMMKVEAKQHNNAVEFRTEYELWLDAKPGSDLWQLNEMELEEYPELCNYPFIKPNKQGQDRFYRMMPVDAGAADYMSKELNKPLRGLPGASRLAMDGETKKRAAELYAERYAEWVQFEQGFDEYVQSYEEQRNQALEAQRATLQAEIDELHRAAWENERRLNTVSESNTPAQTPAASSEQRVTRDVHPPQSLGSPSKRSSSTIRNFNPDELRRKLRHADRDRKEWLAEAGSIDLG